MNKQKMSGDVYVACFVYLLAFVAWGLGQPQNKQTIKAVDG